MTRPGRALRPMTGRFIAPSVAALAFAFASPSSAAGAPPLHARLECRRELSPGRVLCELTVEVRGAGARLAWADALVREVPDFTKPLRSRVGPRQGTRKNPQTIVLPLALVATRSGKGELTVEARGVVCAEPSNKACTPRKQRVRAAVEVGAKERP